MIMITENLLTELCAAAYYYGEKTGDYSMEEFIKTKEAQDIIHNVKDRESNSYG